MTRNGAAMVMSLTPSSSACSISSGIAGISRATADRRWFTSAPSRLAVRAASIAELPPPMTATFGPMAGFLPNAVSLRNGQRGQQAFRVVARDAERLFLPGAEREEDDVVVLGELVELQCFAEFSLNLNWTPALRMKAISLSTIFLGRRYSGSA